jgi:hypothetical protein
MELFTNPWFIVFTGINILATIYLAIKFYYRTKDDPTLFEKLRASGICPTLRTPPKPSDLKGDNTNNNQNH